jgi:hypothetical protein
MGYPIPGVTRLTFAPECLSRPGPGSGPPTSARGEMRKNTEGLESSATTSLRSLRHGSRSLLSLACVNNLIFILF